MLSSVLPGLWSGRDATTARADEGDAAGVLLVSGLFVVELHGLSRARALLVADQIADIVDQAARGLLDGRSAYLLASYVMACRPRVDGDAIDPPLPDPTACTVLCVATLRNCASTYWVALDMKPVDEGAATHSCQGGALYEFTLSQCTLGGCFARHARIDGDGTIDRNEAGAGGCDTCACTWSGFVTLVKRRRPRRRVTVSRRAALVAASLKVHQTLRRDASIGDVVCLCAFAVGEARLRMDPSDGRIARGERTVVALAAQFEGLLLVCLWAGRFGVPQALLIVAEADSGAGSALPKDSPPPCRPSDMLDCAVAIAVRVGLIVARARVAAAEAILKATGRDVDALGAPAPFVGEWRTPRLAISTMNDMDRWARCAADSLLRVRNSPAVAAAIEANRIRASAAMGSGTAPPQPDPEPQPPKHEPDSATEKTRPAAPSVPRCAGSECRSTGRRIVSGCVVATRCTAGCRAAFHGACWKAAGIACAKHTPCPTPDCWGTITQVTSARSRATDRPPRLVWDETCDGRRSPPPGTSTGVQKEDSHRGLPLERHAAGGSDNGDSDAHAGAGNVNGDDADDDNLPRDSVRDGKCHSPQEQGEDDSDRTPATGGTPYQKIDRSREAPSTQRRRTRDRTGKRQRLRLARKQQEQQRLLLLSGLADHATRPGAVEPRPPTDHADDALWPSFFVPDPL